jgi:hypothetical protein
MFAKLTQLADLPKAVLAFSDDSDLASRPFALSVAAA